MTTPIEALAIVEDLIRRDPACFNLSDELQSVRAVLRSIAASLEGDAVERVARIIDPEAWRDRDYYDDYRRLPAPEHHATKSSITKARAILATGLVAGEAAIRADEREKCAKVCDQIRNNAERRAAQHENGEARNSALDKMEGAIQCAAAIRSGAAQNGGE